jgi:ABC-type lipoprotein release transport system permease subunit
MVGVWAMIFMTALMRGMVDEMVRGGIQALPGHLQIHHSDFRDDPTVNNLMPPPDAELQHALDQPDVSAWTSRVRVPAVISSERDTRGVTLIGMEPTGEARISFVGDDMRQGRFLEDTDDQGIVLGAKLVERLETKLGRRVVVMTQGPDNEIVDRGFRVVGVFDSEVSQVEETYAFVARGTLQTLLNIGDRVSEIAVLGTDYRKVDDLLQRVAVAAGVELETLPWTELDSYLGTMLGVMDGFVLVWIVVVFLALSFGLVNTLLMAVFERVREIGLMLALGMKPGTILGQIMAESLMLLTLGLILGNALAWLTIQPLRDGIDVSVVAEGMEMFGASSMLTPSLRLSDMAMASGIVMVLGCLASLSPAWRAARYQPVEAITKV